MTDPHEDFPRAEARVSRGRWPGIVWALPIAALLIAGWLGLRALTDRGIDVELIVPSAQGVRTGDTHVEYNGLEIGSVSAIRLAEDGRNIALTLRIDGSRESLFRTNTHLWVVGANPSFTNIASLRAAVAGPSIGVAPGTGDPARRFVAVRDSPVIDSGTSGRHFRLVAPDLVSITPGTSIYTHGVQVGTIAGITPVGLDGFVVDAFVRDPYVSLVTNSSHFWDANAFQLTPSAGGLQARLTSPSIAALGWRDLRDARPRDRQAGRRPGNALPPLPPIRAPRRRHRWGRKPSTKSRWAVTLAACSPAHPYRCWAIPWAGWSTRNSSMTRAAGRSARR